MNRPGEEETEQYTYRWMSTSSRASLRARSTVFLASKMDMTSGSTEDRKFSMLPVVDTRWVTTRVMLVSPERKISKRENKPERKRFQRTTGGICWCSG